LEYFQNLFSHDFQEEHTFILATTVKSISSTVDEEVIEPESVKIVSEDEDTATEADSDAGYMDDGGIQEPDQRGNGKQILQVPVTEFCVQTFRSFLIYLLTGETHFNHLHSYMEAAPVNQYEDILYQPASPKSLYTLAHRYGHAELRSLALERIVDDLYDYNVSKELVTEFTSKFKEIRRLELRYFKINYGEIRHYESFKTILRDAITHESTKGHPEVWEGIIQTIALSEIKV